MLSQFSCLDTTRNKAPCAMPVDLNTVLIGVCHEDIGVLGQFCAEVITISAFIYTYAKFSCRVKRKISMKQISPESIKHNIFWLFLKAQY